MEVQRDPSVELSQVAGCLRWRHIQAKLAEGDASKTLLRLAERLGERVKSGA